MATYTLISASNISSSTAGVTFSSIPQTYTDLIIRITSRGQSWIQMRFNGSTSTYYEIYGYQQSGSTGYGAVGPQSSIGASGWWQSVPTSNSADTFGTSEVYIPNYTKNASINQVLGILAFRNDTTTSTNGGGTFMVGSWATTTAISEIYVFGSSNFVAGSKIYLYGISKS